MSVPNTLDGLRVCPGTQDYVFALIELGLPHRGVFRRLVRQRTGCTKSHLASLYQASFLTMDGHFYGMWDWRICRAAYAVRAEMLHATFFISQKKATQALGAASPVLHAAPRHAARDGKVFLLRSDIGIERGTYPKSKRKRARLASRLQTVGFVVPVEAETSA